MVGAHRRQTTIDSPPAYHVVGQRGSVAGPSRLNSGFSNLSLSDAPRYPQVDTCLVHLRLLYTFHNLKDDVGFSDGLFGLWDARYPATPTNPSKALASLREKRWALFVARAVDRYEAWWNSLGSQYLTERDMEKDRTRYLNFMANWEPMNWSEDDMPPLGMLELSCGINALSEHLLTIAKDVLLVLHAHMLNPRIFLEVSLDDSRATSSPRLTC
jgi:hypothetical protein